MKTVAYFSNDHVEVKEIPIPKIGKKSILLEIRAACICGSDLQEEHRKPRVKKLEEQGGFLTPGHEISGKVVEVGEDVNGIYVGESIFVTHHVPCEDKEKCRPCRRNNPTQCDDFRKKNYFKPGGMAGYVEISGRSLVTGVIKTSEITYAEASCIEPLGTVIEWTMHTKKTIEEDNTFLILGSGAAGLLTAEYAKSRGVEKIITTDINKSKLNLARSILREQDHAIHANELTPDYIKDLNHGRLVDWVIVCGGGIPVIEQARQLYEDGGYVINFAIPPKGKKAENEPYLECRKAGTIQFTYGASPKANQIAYTLIRDKEVNVNSIITHRLSLEEAAEGFKIASKGQDSQGNPVGKVLFEPHTKPA